MTQTEQQKSAKLFAENWANKGDEKQETSRYWIGLLQNVLGVRDAPSYIEFEKKVKRIESHTDSELLDNSNAKNENTSKTENVSNPRGNFLQCTIEQAKKIEQTAKAILDAREKYPDSSLADLYDETLMPPDLRKAHESNDKAVMQAYVFDAKMTEAEIVAELFKMYERLSGQAR